MPRRYSPRIRTFDYTGTYRYLWTICCDKRKTLFTSRPVVDDVLSQFLRASRDENVAILAYCFMPDHLHLLLEGRDGRSAAARFVSRAKQLSGFRYSQCHGKRLWQRSSWDRVLRSEEDTWTAIRYVLANPVRAGLVQHPAEYPFSGSAELTREMVMASFELSDGPAG